MIRLGGARGPNGQEDHRHEDPPGELKQR
ncbi:MAG: hypothetical protein FD129_1743, partial [bacterium]